jgi:hypothetical protein
MKLLSSFKTGLTVAAFAAVAMAGAAVPAQASSITFGFGGFGGFPSGVHLHFGDPSYYNYCLEDDGIIDRLEHRGYSYVHIIRHDHDDDFDNKVWVVGQDWHGDWYQMRVDRCTHAVDHLHLVHSHHDKGNFDYGHFSFNFNF